MAVSPRAALAAIAGTLVSLGLAIVGWGGVSAFFSHPARVALTVVTLVLVVVSLLTGGNLSPGEREVRGNRWVLACFAVLGLLHAYVPPFTDRHEMGTLDGDATRWLG